MSRLYSRVRRHAPPERRGITTVVAVVVLAIVLAMVGVTSYALLGGFSSKGPKTTCSPPTAPSCGVYENLHDISLLLPFQSVQQNASVPFVASLPSGETTSQYTFNYGDGTAPNVTSTTITHHAYATPGDYIVSITASVGGQTHDNYHNLVPVLVTPSSTSTGQGTAPSVEGEILGNATTQGVAATAVVAINQFVEVSGSYSSAPTDPQFNPVAPKIVASNGGVLSSVTDTNTSAQADVTYSSAGIYQVTFVGSASDGTVVSYSNYTWTVFVEAPGVHASLGHSAVHTSPHPGTIISYELVPGGALSEDPAIDYETAGYEPILNVYQTLISYNGTDTGPGWENYVPVLATCVPGSPQCAKMYGGDTLINGNNYTFVIQGNASFYDPATGNSWGVYPTDVLFSIARTLAFSTLPCVTCNNGWILAQSLLDHGNGTWSGIHGSYNNTPQNVYNAITVNGTDCPASAMTTDHGCVTFNVFGDNKPWPYFLELITDGLGGSIVPCGWFSAPAQGAGIPYWTQGNVTGSGDHPCPMPGTDGYGLTPADTPILGWDHWEEAGSGYFGTYLGHVQFNMVGSGPYYMQDYQIAAAYTLKANPAYGQNPYCTWTGCQPAKGSYASTVEVTWETQATPGELEYQAGVADFATIPSTDISLLLQLISEGKVRAETGPTLSIGFRPFNLDYNLQGAQRFASGPVTIPQDFFSYVGMRAFFSYVYPYQTVQTTYNTVHGIELGFLSGGAIPQFMANYYPTNIAWPSQNPCSSATDPACPTYWWTQMQDPSSPYYDPESLACTSANPCEFPLFGQTGDPAGDAVNALYATELAQFSNGGIKADPIDVNFQTIVANSLYSGPGQNPMPFYSLGWAPDYPDPTDYVNPLYNNNATYTNSDSVEQQLLTPTFGSPTAGCQGFGSTKDLANWALDNASEQYYAANPVNNSCQGFAYEDMEQVLGEAAFDTNLTQRVLLYDLAEEIAFHLYLYVYTGQSNQLIDAAAWVNPASFNTNVTIGGGGDTPFFELTGNGVQYAGST